MKHCLKELNADSGKPIMLPGAYTPLLVLELIKLGVDMFDSSYAYCAAVNFKALSFSWDEKEIDVSATPFIDVTDDGKTSSGLKEWAILELQGDLEVRTNEDMHDQFVGDLYYNKYGQPILIIGHHILQGREQKLEKPFAVLEKSKTNEGQHLLDQTVTNLNASVINNTVDRTLLDNTVALENKTKQRTEYTVQAIVTKKLTFKSRPKPIIANVAKSV
ncbi:chromosome transmission fidelity protein 8 homolog isoform X1 [Musca autumnalis]|uniref:chromosome transmission fidelity protein 8 homolog isoform X1 n=1 Tax=Musca autumnalis TaxID=221902 RepID=UPI003CFA66AA